jgi:hypothetical protein
MEARDGLSFIFDFLLSSRGRLYRINHTAGLDGATALGLSFSLSLFFLGQHDASSACLQTKDQLWDICSGVGV